MKYFIDYKVTTWNRIYFKKEADVETLKYHLRNGIIPHELCNDKIGFDYHHDNIEEQDEFVEPEHNNNNATIRLYNEEGKELWNNNPKILEERIQEEKSIISDLNGLVFIRLNKETLEAKLSSIFNCKITVEEQEYDEHSGADYNYMFTVEGDFCGYGNIYFTKMRIKSWDNSDIYITEVDYNFE